MKLFWKAFTNVLLRMLTKPMWVMLLISLGVMSLVYSKGGLWDLPIAVIDEDHSSASRQLRRELEANPRVDVMVYNDVNTALNDLYARKLFTILIFPRNFEKKILRGDKVTIVAYGDTTNRMSNGIIQRDLTQAYQQLSMNYNQKLLKNAGLSQTQVDVILSPIKAQQNELFNPGINFAAVILPGILLMLLQHSLLLASSRVNIALNSLPQKPPRAVYLGSLAALLPIWLFLCVVLFVIWPALLGYRQEAPIYVLLGLAFPFLLSVLGLSKLITSCLTRVDLIYLTLSFLTTPVFYLSGIIWPVQAMPEWVIVISHMLPSTWATNMIVGVNQLGESVLLDTVGMNLLMLVLLGLIYATLGMMIEALRTGTIRRWFKKPSHPALDEHTEKQ